VVTGCGLSLVERPAQGGLYADYLEDRWGDRGSAELLGLVRSTQNVRLEAVRAERGEGLRAFRPVAVSADRNAILRNVELRVITRSGSTKGSGLMRTLLTKLKIAVLAPIPIARVARTTTVKPGLARNVLSVKRRSCSTG